MNTKQKLFTFTSIGAVFATAIAFVAVTGARNLKELQAENKYSITITHEHVLRDDEYSDDNYQSFYVFAKTNSGDDFDSIGYPSAYGDISSSCGVDGHILTVKNNPNPNTHYQGNFYINFEVQNVSGDVTCVLNGDFLLGDGSKGKQSTINVDIDQTKIFDEDHEYGYYQVNIAVEEILEATLDSIVISYTC